MAQGHVPQPNTVCCLNPTCAQPRNPEGTQVCQSCGTEIIPLLRGRYRPIHPIGQGGFGKTYLAVDADRLSSYCVIKQFSPHPQGTQSLDKAIQLFNQEAIRLDQLGEHPQIPSLLAYFEQDQYLYLIQQLIQGQTLAWELQNQGVFSEQKIWALLDNLLPVLQFIHDRQVIHRDITPANIIRRKLDNQPVLIDFGVAKQLSVTALAQKGTKIGTEGYAPMEQLRSGKVYPSSDLYSLGVTCLHLLTNTKPEDLYNPLDGRWMWREQLEKLGTPASPALGKILDKLVRDLVSERYRSAAEVLAEVRASPPSLRTTGVTVAASQFAAPGYQNSGQNSGLSSGQLQTSPKTAVPHGSPSASDRRSSPLTGSGTAQVSAPAASRPTSRSVRQPQSGMPSGVPSAPARSTGLVSRPSISQPRSSQQSVSGAQRRGWTCVQNLEGHRSWVTAIALSPKAPLLASGSLDDTIRLWDLRTGSLMKTMSAHPRGGVNSIKIDPTGQVLTSCSDDDTVKIWQLHTGELLHTLTDHSRDVNSVAIGCGGRVLASGSEDNSVKLWDLTQGTLLNTLAGSTMGMVKTISFSPDGRTLAAGTFNHRICLWDTQTGQFLRALTGHLHPIHDVAFSPDGRLLASASKDKTIRVWDLQTGALRHTLTGHNRDVNAIAISPDGRALVSGSGDSTIKLWKISTGSLRGSLSGHAGSVTALSISANGQLIASGGLDKTIKIWRVPQRSGSRSLSRSK